MPTTTPGLLNRCNQCKTRLGGGHGSGGKHAEETGHQWRPAYACAGCGLAYRKKKRCKAHITTCPAAAQPESASRTVPSIGSHLSSAGNPSVLSHPVTVIPNPAPTLGDTVTSYRTQPPSGANILVSSTASPVREKDAQSGVAQLSTNETITFRSLEANNAASEGQCPDSDGEGTGWTKVDVHASGQCPEATGGEGHEDVPTLTAPSESHAVLHVGTSNPNSIKLDSTGDPDASGVVQSDGSQDLLPSSSHFAGGYPELPLQSSDNDSPDPAEVPSAASSSRSETNASSVAPVSQGSYGNCRGRQRQLSLCSTSGNTRHPHEPSSLRWNCRACFADPCIEPVATICGHIFCHSCIVKEMASAMACPVCRKVFLVKLDV